MILQPVFSIFPCSPLPSGTCRTPSPDYSNDNSVSLVFRIYELPMCTHFPQKQTRLRRSRRQTQKYPITPFRQYCGFLPRAADNSKIHSVLSLQYCGSLLRAVKISTSILRLYFFKVADLCETSQKFPGQPIIPGVVENPQSCGLSPELDIHKSIL